MISTAGQGSNARAQDRDLEPSSNTDSYDDAQSDTVVGAKEEEEADNEARLAELAKNEHQANEEDDGNVFSTEFGRVKNEAEAAQLSEEATLPPEPDVEAIVSERSSVSGPDDTPSVQGSVRSSPSNSIPASRASSRLGLPASPQPFDRRFKARISSASSVPRAISPAFLTTHSRQSSVSSQLTLRSQEDWTPEHNATPWEVIKWTKLRKISQQALSESGKRAFGKPTHMTIGSSIAVGTSKGIVLLFDYQQVLKNIIGQGTAAAECGPVTALAISADHSTVATGHSNGTIFTWDLSHPAKPFLHIPPRSRSDHPGRTHAGHLRDCAILHVGFLGQRHTALASADDSGMAFSHLATRGLGALGRTIKSTRILGRYPDLSTSARKPSSVLAFAPLPLGNVEQATDEFGLTALLTPYLLVVISTTPVAQTQYKHPRPKEIAPHSALTGCLAWFPAVKLKEATSKHSSRTKLVYCWSNVLNVVEIQERQQDEPSGPEHTVELDFVHNGRWTCDEAILAVQWLSRSILVVLTITQRLVIVEDETFRVADSVDLVSKHVYHADLFSRQLQPLVDKIEQTDGSLHGVLPDAYHMSFKAYKGRLFLLGMNDVLMGTLSNWADRLTATLDAGNPITAVKLALSYYTGSSGKVTIGLPDEADKRHGLVGGKLLSLLSGSLEYILNDESKRNSEHDLRTVLQDFVNVAFEACVTINEVDFLFDEVYEHYSDASMQDVFLFELESYILDAKIEVVPPNILKDMLVWYESLELGDRLQIMICSLQTSTMDLDQVSGVCRRMHLYDALIYIWNDGLDDFITPLIDLMRLAPVREGEEEEEESSDDVQKQLDIAMKMFPYMAYGLTGRRYPGGQELSGNQAIKARSSLYTFVFAAKPVHYPFPYGPLVTFGQYDGAQAYPYLQLLLRFDKFSLLSMLNEAFEDTYLDEEEQTSNDIGQHGMFGALAEGPITRQRVVRILLAVFASPSFGPEDKVLLDIFLARNLPKFPQSILLSSSILHQILVELCRNPSGDLRDECQLSVEYLLSVYAPTDVQELIGLLAGAEYYNVLKSAYRSSHQYAKWLESFFVDPDDRESVYSCIADCLRTGSALSKRQALEVKEIISLHASDLMTISPSLTARTLQSYAPDLLEHALQSAILDSYAQYLFLQTLLETCDTSGITPYDLGHQYQESYVKLMCKHNPHHVADYIATIDSSSLKIDDVLKTMEASNVVDAAVILLQHEGLARTAMDRLQKHFETLRAALEGLLYMESPDIANTEESINDILSEASKYVKLGVWLCQGEASKAKCSAPNSPDLKRSPTSSFLYTENDLTAVELLWLDLIHATVSMHQVLPQAFRGASRFVDGLEDEKSLVASTLSELVQSTFAALLTSSAAREHMPTPTAGFRPSRQNSQLSGRESPSLPRFPPVLSTLLTRLSYQVSSTALILPLLGDLLSSSAFESGILGLAQSFLDKDVFALVQEADARRRKGWRPAGRGCDVCGRRCWGPGAGIKIWQAWEGWRSGQSDRGQHRPMFDGPDHGEETRGRSKGKAKAKPQADGDDEVLGESERTPTTSTLDTLVVFTCQHLFHRVCLTATLQGGADDGSTDPKYICPICKSS